MITPANLQVIPSDIVWLPDNHIRLAVPWDENTIQVWQDDEWETRTIITVDAYSQDILLSPDGARLAVAYRDRNLMEILDAQTGKTVCMKSRRRAALEDISPDGSLIAVLDDDYTVYLFRTKSCSKEAQRSGLDPTTISFSPDGSLIAMGHSDGTITLWETTKFLVGN